MSLAPFPDFFDDVIIIQYIQTAPDSGPLVLFTVTIHAISIYHWHKRICCYNNCVSMHHCTIFNLQPLNIVNYSF